MAAAPPAREAAWLAAPAIAAAHLALKAWHLGRASLWLDDAVAVHIAQRDALGIVQASRGDTTPPLYYLVLGACERLFGLSEAAVRVPSVAASSLTAAALFLLARRWLGGAGAWLASALFFLSDVNLRYAREARPYALAALLCVLSFALFLRALERPRWPTFAALAAVNLAMLLTHYATAFALVAEGAALLWPWRSWTALRRFLATQVPVALVLLAWIAGLVLAGQQHHMDWMGPAHGTRLNAVLNRLAGGRPGGPAFLVLATGAAAALVLARSRGERTPRALPPLLFFALVPVAVSVLTSPFVRTLHARYLLYASPALVLVWAAAALALPAGWPRLGGAALACLISATAFGRGLHAREADWRGASALASACPADRVLLTPPWSEAPFAYYYDPAAFRDFDRTSARLAADGVRPVPEDADLAALDVAASREVLWVVAGPRRPGERIPRLLAEAGFKAVEPQAFEGVVVRRFAREPGAARPCPAAAAPR